MRTLMRKVGQVKARHQCQRIGICALFISLSKGFDTAAWSIKVFAAEYKNDVLFEKR